MMRPIPRAILLVLSLSLCALATSPASARPRVAHGRSFESNKTFGLGLMLGAPTGLSGKYYLSSDNALDFGVGFIRYYRERDGLHLHLDYLWHPVSLVSAAAFEMPLYVGVGGRLFDFDDNNDDAFAVGVRAPIGIAFDFNNAPLDVFFELAFVLDFFSGYSDRVGADVNGAIGVRFYFQ